MAKLPWPNRHPVPQGCTVTLVFRAGVLTSYSHIVQREPVLSGQAMYRSLERRHSYARLQSTVGHLPLRISARFKKYSLYFLYLVSTQGHSLLKNSATTCSSTLPKRSSTETHTHTHKRFHACCGEVREEIYKRLFFIETTLSLLCASLPLQRDCIRSSICGGEGAWMGRKGDAQSSGPLSFISLIAACSKQPGFPATLVPSVTCSPP